MDEKIEKFIQMVDECSKIVFFGGAGVSTESGIPDFRSVDGLYNQKWDYPPETILSNTFFFHNTKEFYRFYREKLLIKGIEPNVTHKKLAELEAKGKLLAVVTQNIDGLHQLAGSKKVYELHGTIMKNHCLECNKFYDLDYVESHFDSDGIPRCECGGLIKPDVVLYEEGLDNATVEGAINAISSADMLIIAGTSLTVYPAAGFVRSFKGKYLVILNKTPTQTDQFADLVINDSMGKVFEQLNLE